MNRKEMIRLAIKDALVELSQTTEEFKELDVLEDRELWDAVIDAGTTAMIDELSAVELDWWSKV
ncbi:hypothetical protein LCGC14_1637170 [marine sediment metagenome]|uniref:Uncharacterized protein n=1 Tax=marine sediment metagenome TaxID=412755 RepID=A0A0F9KGI5_9ZZZZ